MKPPAYTVPEQDADLWTCGRRLTGEGAAMSKPSRTDLRDEALALLDAAGRDGYPSISALARALDALPDRVDRALRGTSVWTFARPIRHPRHRLPGD